MTWSKCTTSIRHKKIKLHDPRSKRHAIFLNPDEFDHSRTQSDGCWVVGTTAADWVLTELITQHQVIVELKGKDVDHACDQVLATAARLKSEGKLGKRLAGLVVCTEYPRHNTKIQRARLQFARDFKGPIHAVTKSRDFSLSKVLAFDGPG